MQTPFVQVRPRGEARDRPTWPERLLRAVRERFTVPADRSLENAKFTDSFERELLDRRISTLLR